jgi:hypothetical protein
MSARPGDELRLVTDEADAALAILAAFAGGARPDEAAWQRLFASTGYKLLGRREASMKRPFGDADFRAFLSAPETVAKATELARIVADWKQRSLAHAAALAHAYLPARAPIRAEVLLVIKPKTNSFVFKEGGASYIFLYVDPQRTPEQFENTAAHELHHIGFGEACPARKALEYTAPVALAREFVGGFGEGFAMRAAAGGPTVHPHAVSAPVDRARWDRDLARADADLAAVEHFLTEVLDGKFKHEDEAVQAAQPFWGEQGAWYTVGWRMAARIEQRFGRARFIADECDPVALLRDANAATPPGGARFGDAFLARLAGKR